ITITVIDTVFTSEDTTICEGSSYQLPDGSIVNTPGQYFSYLNAVNSCDSVVTTNLTVEVCSGVNNFESDGFLVYPNPASDILYINNGTINDENLTLKIYNVIGELIHTQKLQQNHQQINIGDLSNGVYVLEIKSEGWSERQKLIIQR
ncbi:MAG: T9SS type A sorting domain-containing protein, partial [Bacteroidetes bacterium]|nr:T9SS type A sorting domain-containing protein [Bacteroidota bacterium]